MSSAPTLNSRLRVLVAKAFRAEKLYSSMSTNKGVSTKAERFSNPAVLAEAAGEIRAKEWQRNYYQLRIALNDILSIASSSTIASEIAALRDRFIARAKECSVLVDRGVEELQDTGRRHEFVHTFKLSLELIRTKAQAQAAAVIAEELVAILDASGRTNATSENSKVTRPDSIMLKHQINSQSAGNQSKGGATRAEESSTAVESYPTNVVQFSKRVAYGTKKF